MIKHIGNFKDRKTEGMTKLCKLICSISCDKNITHYHSNGIKEALKIISKKKTVYSLYSNLEINLSKRITAIINNKNMYGTKSLTMIKHIVLSLLYGNIPLQFKQKLLKKFTKVIVPTQYLKKRLNLKNVEVIPFGIDTDKFVPKKNNNKKIVISYIGSATLEKGFFETVEAFKYSTNNNIEFRMYLPVIPKNFDFPLNIKLFETLTNIEQSYQQSDIIVMPHLTMTASVAIPLVMLEAMSCGCIVLTTPLPHIKEIGKYYVVYCNKDLSDLKNRINDLSYNIQSMQMLRTDARQHIIDNYNEKDMLNSYKKLYEEI